MATHITVDPDGPGIPAYGNTKKKPKRKKRYKPLPPKEPCPFNEGVECRTFKCDYCGFNPDRKEKVEEPVEVIPFCDRLRELVDEKGITTKQFEDDTGIARRIFYKQTSAIHRSTLMACAYYLGVNVEDMIEGTNAMDFWYV